MAGDANLTTALKAAKSKPMFFAFVAKGNEGKLLVEKSKVPSKDTAQAKKDCGGGTIFQGRCLFEDDSMVFELPAEPPATLAALLKKIIKTDAGLTMNVVFRVNTALAEDTPAGAEHGAEPGAVSGAPPAASAAPATAAPASPAQHDPRAALAMKRLAALSAGIKTALTGPNKAQVQALVLSVNTHIKQSDFDAAEKSLHELVALVGGPPSPTASVPPAPPAPHAPSPSPSPSGSAPDGAHVIKRLNAMTADIKVALTGPNKDAVQKRFIAVNASIKNHDYAAADKTLDELEGLVKGAKPGGNGQGTGDESKLSVMKLGKARIEWGQACSKAVADIGELMEMIHDEFEDETDQQTQLAAAKKRVEGLIAELKDELGPALDDVLNAQDDKQRKPFIDHAKAMLAKFVKIVQDDPIMTKLDGNELMPEMQVRAPLQGKLHEIAAALG